MSVLSIGISGRALTKTEMAQLNHPWVGGVTLFKRNIGSPAQIRALIAEIRAAASAPMVLSVDQEGGRVQRVLDGVSKLPALGAIGEVWRAEPDRALALARAHASVMAGEMLALGFDVSFAPVLDLNAGSRVIGDRAFSTDPHAVSALATAYVEALNACGMAACLKHFPGHGSVLEDTHHEKAVDTRSLAELEASDLIPFVALLPKAQAVMLAHVEYPAVDAAPAGYSQVWIRQILRQRYGFSGVVISDDIGMSGAGHALRAVERISAHLNAGCDHVLVCDPELATTVLAELKGAAPLVAAPISRLRALEAEPAALAESRALLHTALHMPLLS